MNNGDVAWSGAGLGLKEQRWARDYFWGLPDLRFLNFDANLSPVDGPRQKIGSSKRRRTCVDMANTRWVSSKRLDCLLGRSLVQKCVLEYVYVQRKRRIWLIGLVVGVERRRELCILPARWSLTAASLPLGFARRKLERQPPTSRSIVCRSRNF